MNIFYKRLKSLRIESGLSQQDIADKLNISRSAIGKYETGAAYPDIEKLIMLAGLYNCSVDYLLGISDNNPILTKEELELIQNYRLLDERGKAVVNSVINVEHEQLNIDKGDKKATG